jgi:hypothetical protein
LFTAPITQYASIGPVNAVSTMNHQKYCIARRSACARDVALEPK